MHEIEFFQLQRSVQDRLIRATRGEVPVPLMVAPTPLRAPRAWTALGTAALLAAVVVGALGFGSLHSTLAIQPATWVAGYSGPLALGVFCILMAFALRQRSAAMPFRPWIFFFPCGVIDARKSCLRIHSLDEFEGIDTTQGSSVVQARFSGGVRFAFDVGDPAKVEKAVAAIGEAQRLWQASATPERQRERTLLDPLMDTGFTSPFSPTAPRVPPRRVRVPLLLGIGLLAGAVVGSAAWAARNRLSARRMYDAALQLNSPQAYRAYLAHGGKVAAVPEVLLPRAELRVAQKAGTVEAMDRYVLDHPRSKIQVEVDAVYRVALLAALEKAKQLGSLSALVDLEKGHPGSTLIKPELEAAKTAVFQKVLDAFQEASPSASPQVVTTFTELLRYARRNGPKVEVRFKRKLPSNVTQLEKAIRMSRSFTGDEMMPLPYFDTAHGEERERWVSEQLLPRLQQAFPKDVLDFQAGPRIADDQELGEVKVPTLYIERNVTLSGAFPSLAPRGVFAGVGTNYRVELYIPGATTQFSFKYSTWSPPHLRVYKEEGGKPEDVYRSTTRASIDKFVKKLLDYVFAKPK
ncbi:MAG: hypothetical protein JW940_07110 [Polyangiaceae bacterium]|nr:hypothetical protein [Polyangiaceae bacterium]